jgi:segregation and condensation protein B
MNETYIKNVVEAALLAAGRPLQIAELGQLFDENVRPDPAGLRAALDALEAEYSSRGIEVKETATGFRIQVKRDLANEVSRLWPERPPRYSRALLETLALIAYRQPITRGEIEAVRGVAVNPNIIKTVLERNWVRVVGTRDVPGRPELLGTTKEFLDYFGLRSLEDLPPLAELKAMGEINLQLDLAKPGESGEGSSGTGGAGGEGGAGGDGGADGGSNGAGGAEGSGGADDGSSGAGGANESGDIGNANVASGADGAGTGGNANVARGADENAVRGAEAGVGVSAAAVAIAGAVAASAVAEGAVGAAGAAAAGSVDADAAAGEAAAGEVSVGEGAANDAAAAEVEAEYSFSSSDVAVSVGQVEADGAIAVSAAARNDVEAGSDIAAAGDVVTSAEPRLVDADDVAVTDVGEVEVGQVVVAARSPDVEGDNAATADAIAGLGTDADDGDSLDDVVAEINAAAEIDEAAGGHATANVDETALDVAVARRRPADLDASAGDLDTVPQVDAIAEVTVLEVRASQGEPAASSERSAEAVVDSSEVTIESIAPVFAQASAYEVPVAPPLAESDSGEVTVEVETLGLVEARIEATLESDEPMIASDTAIETGQFELAELGVAGKLGAAGNEAHATVIEAEFDIEDLDVTSDDDSSDADDEEELSAAPHSSTGLVASPRDRDD